MPCVGWDKDPVASFEIFPPEILVFQDGLTLQKHHPFVDILLQPGALRGRLTRGDYLFDLYRWTGKKSFKDLFFGQDLRQGEKVT